jgi:hypothetical protein
MEEAIYTFLALSQAGTTNPLLGAFSQVCKLRVRLHIAAIFHISQICKLEDVSYSCIHQHVCVHQRPETWSGCCEDDLGSNPGQHATPLHGFCWMWLLQPSSLSWVLCLLEVSPRLLGPCANYWCHLRAVMPSVAYPGCSPPLCQLLVSPSCSDAKCGLSRLQSPVVKKD